MVKLNLLHLYDHDIYEQLQLEEALLRVTSENWCILNHGSPRRIIMGISGRPHELIDAEKIAVSPIPIIKRYSGGGTVVVDPNTLFVSFIFQKEIHDFPCYPEPILKWSEEFYQEALNIHDFHLRENDYVIGKRKCGGNAQYIKKDRFVHHTTFLWDYTKENMDYLLHPTKTPNYRQGRAHHDFLCRLKDYLPSPENFFDSLQATLSKRYTINTTSLAELTPLLDQPYRKATVQLEV